MHIDRLEHLNILPSIIVGLNCVVIRLLDHILSCDILFEKMLDLMLMRTPVCFSECSAIN